jgi:hypothetical protein
MLVVKAFMDAVIGVVAYSMPPDAIIKRADVGEIVY